MKISYNWLKEYINFSITPQELSILLTNCGLEVEELEHWQSVKGGLNGIVLGKVIEKDKHPNADKLSLTKVDIGNGEILKIVCGAPNVDAGQNVAIATVGAKIYSGDDSFEIKSAKIRGEESFGMICSEKELGIGDSHEGIMVLPQDAVAGTKAKDYFNITEDWIFTLGLTPNRVDAASHIGVARDIMAAINANSSSKVSLNIPNFELKPKSQNELKVDVIVEDTDACPRYSGITLNNIKVKPSPKWLADRLSSVGLRPINNVVDITNYVMLTFGQPLHAFDLKKVKNNKIVIKKFDKEFDFLCLDEQSRKISTEDLMICNSDEAMCIAGVFGGLDSGVNENTTSIFIESAYFHPVSVRKTSNRHSLKTDSAFRFERGADISATIDAMKMAASMICELAEAEISSDIYDVYPVKKEKENIKLNFDFVDKLIGHQIPKDKQISILKDLDFEISDQNENSINLKAPFAKVDVTRPADVVEEILRIFGYNNIPEPTSMRTNLSKFSTPNPHHTKNVISEILVSQGFYEIMTNSLSSAEFYIPEFGFEATENVKLLNPLSNELNTMRRSMIFSGLQSITYNINRKQNNIRFFEFGKIYSKLSDDKSFDILKRFEEHTQLAIYLSGENQEQNWKYKAENVDFYILKQTILNVLLRLGIKEENLISEELDSPLFAYAIKLKLKDKDMQIANFGLLSKKVTEKTECRQEVFFGEINWDNVIEVSNKEKLSVTEISKFPEVRRDIAMLLDKTTKYEAVKEIVVKNSDSKLISTSLFDIYEGKNLPEGKKSYAISIILQDKDKTLTDKETDKIVNKIKKQLEERLGAIIR